MLSINDLVANEQQRLAAVRLYDILDTPPDKTFERLAKLAARFFNTPISLISIVDRDRIWFKSHYGLDIQQIDRALGLCASAILQNDVYTVTDAQNDPRTLANPLVVGEFGLRFYAAAPLQTTEGFNLGTICVIDFSPREVTNAEKETLKDLAAIVMAEMELRLSARATVVYEVNQRLQVLKEKEQAEQVTNTDVLTGLQNRRAFDTKLEWQALHISEHGGDAAVAIIDLDGLKTVNDTMGSAQGDLVIKSFASALQAGFRQEDTIYRFGSDEFAIILPRRRIEDFESLKHSIQQRLESAITQTRQLVLARVGASVGMATLSEVDGWQQEVVRLAAARMYVQKLENRRSSRRSR